MERLFQILAVILAGIAAYFLWTGNGDGAFISAVFGAVSFFLSIRFQVKERLEQRAAGRAEEEKKVPGSKFQVSGQEIFLTTDDQITNGEKQRPTNKEQV